VTVIRLHPKSELRHRTGQVRVSPPRFVPEIPHVLSGDLGERGRGCRRVNRRWRLLCHGKRRADGRVGHLPNDLRLDGSLRDAR